MPTRASPIGRPIRRGSTRLTDHNARNDLPARVFAIERGDVMAQVDVRLDGADDRMSSVMMADSLHAMGLAEGGAVHVLAKAINVLLTRP